MERVIAKYDIIRRILSKFSSRQVLDVKLGGLAVKYSVGCVGNLRVSLRSLTLPICPQK